MKIIRVFARFAQAYLFYPVMIGLFLWLYFTKAHWIFGVAVIAAILILDPIWRTIARNVRHKLRSRNSKK